MNQTVNNPEDLCLAQTTLNPWVVLGKVIGGVIRRYTGSFIVVLLRTTFFSWRKHASQVCRLEQRSLGMGPVRKDCKVHCKSPWGFGVATPCLVIHPWHSEGTTTLQVQYTEKLQPKLEWCTFHQT